MTIDSVVNIRSWIRGLTMIVGRSGSGRTNLIKEICEMFDKKVIYIRNSQEASLSYLKETLPSRIELEQCKIIVIDDFASKVEGEEAFETIMILKELSGKFNVAVLITGDVKKGSRPDERIKIINIRSSSGLIPLFHCIFSIENIENDMYELRVLKSKLPLRSERELVLL